MHPQLDAIVVVPMFPHTLTSRPLMVPSDCEIRIGVGQDARVSCDSQVDFSLKRGDEVRIGKAPAPLRLVYSLGHSFYDSCRSKLDWASRRESVSLPGVPRLRGGRCRAARPDH